MPQEIQVQYLEKPEAGDAEQRFPKECVRIGRCRDNDLAIEGTKLSRYHAELFVAGGKLKVRDLGSRNGTWVNGARVSGEAAVEPVDVLMLGEGGPKVRVSLIPEKKLAEKPAPAARAHPGTETTLVEKLANVPADSPTVAPAHAAAPAPGPAPASPLKAKKSDPGKQAIGQSTLFLAMDALQAQQRTRTQKLMALAVAAITFLVLVAAVIVLLVAKHSSSEGEKVDGELRRLEDKIRSSDERAADLEAQIKERDEALEKIRQQQGLSDAERAELLSRTEGQLSSLRSELKKNQEAIGTGPQVWADIVDRYKESVFLCVRRARDSSGFGTAFVVGDGVLATNAHVALLMKPDSETFVIQNGTGRVFKLTDRASSPEFNGPSSPDVGLLRIDLEGTKLEPLPLASDDDLAKLRIGTQLGTLGYPGELAQTYFQNFDAKARRYKSAVATFKDGWIGQITNYRSEMADFRGSTRIQHSASLTGGTSGSPMFTADGKVVALNNSSLDIVMPRGGQQPKITTKSAAQIGYAIRVDELRRFMKEKGW